jgi:iron complex transport system substrate-binding protein
MITSLDTKDSKNTKDTKTQLERPRALVHVRKVIAFVFFVFFVSFVSFVFGDAAAQGAPRRIISLVPNVTEILFAIGAGPQVVAVSSYDVEPPEVRSLPAVGALIDPDTERIIALKPDLVVTYGSQADLQTQLKAARIPFFDYRHGGLDHVMATMRALGARTGHAEQAEAVARRLQASIDAVRQRVAGKPRPKTLLVFGREPGSLRNIYASAGRGFLHDMLEAAGGEDVLNDIQKESAQISTETILARSPEVIIELNAANRLNEADLKAVLDPWSALSAVPAVRNKRVIVLMGSGLTVPGPRVIEGLEKMARALHP